MNDPEFHKDDSKTGAYAAFAAVIALLILLLLGILTMPEASLLLVISASICLVFVWYVTSLNKRDPLISIRNTKEISDRAKGFGRFAEALQQPVFIVGAGGTIRYVNSAGAKVFQNPIVGELVTVRFRQPDLRRAIEAALSEKKIVSIEYNEAVPDDRWFMVEVSPIPDSASASNNRKDLFVIVFHELTETKRIDQMRSDFVANASHELRTPLASLVGYLETLNGPAKNDEKAKEKFVGVMLDQAERMSRLVNDLLSLSRIEMKTHLKPSDTVNLTEVLASVIDSLEQLASQMGVSINFDKSTDVHIVGDRDDLLQVFENVIENGCKYGQDGGQVDVEIITPENEAEDRVIVSVKDYGPGIAAEHQQRITERFYRVDVARSREKQGTGLGLAIVKHILQRHGTRLQVRSKLGEGTEFRVQFKLASVENTE